MSWNKTSSHTHTHTESTLRIYIAMFREITHKAYRNGTEFISFVDRISLQQAINSFRIWMPFCFYCSFTYLIHGFLFRSLWSFPSSTHFSHACYNTVNGFGTIDKWRTSENGARVYAVRVLKREYLDLSTRFALKTHTWPNHWSTDLLVCNLTN